MRLECFGASRPPKHHQTRFLGVLGDSCFGFWPPETLYGAPPLPKRWFCSKSTGGARQPILKTEVPSGVEKVSKVIRYSFVNGDSMNYIKKAPGFHHSGVWTHPELSDCFSVQKISWKKGTNVSKKKYHRNLENRKKYESSGIDGGGSEGLILSYFLSYQTPMP